MKKLFLGTLGILAPFAPMVALAATTIDDTYIGSVAGLIQNILAWAIPVLITLATIWFIWEIITYIRAEPGKKAEAGKGLLFSILGLFLIVSIWGVIAIIQGTTGAGSGGIQQSDLPVIQGF